MRTKGVTRAQRGVGARSILQRWRQVEVDEGANAGHGNCGERYRANYVFLVMEAWWTAAVPLASRAVSHSNLWARRCSAPRCLPRNRAGTSRTADMVTSPEHQR